LALRRALQVLLRIMAEPKITACQTMAYEPILYKSNLFTLFFTKLKFYQASVEIYEKERRLLNTILN
jgi:hypothetical protein